MADESRNTGVIIPLGGDPAKPADEGLPRLDVRVAEEKKLTDQGERQRIIMQITSSDSERRKKEHRKRAEVYRDGTRQYALRALKNELSGDTYKEMEARTPNVSITKKIVNKKARVYLSAPARPLNGTEATPPEAGKVQASKPQQALEKTIELIGLDRFMKKVNRWLELHHNVFVSVLPVKFEDADGSIKYRPNLDLHQPENYDVIADFQTGKEVVAVIFSYFTNADPDVGVPTYRTSSGTVGQLIEGPSQAQGTPKTERRFVWWSKNYHFTTNEKGVIVSEPDDKIDGVGANPIKRLPGVTINKDQANGYWSEGGEDLTDNSILINVLMADMYYIAKFQGMGIIVITGKGVPRDIRVGPSRTVVLEHTDKEDPEPKVQVVNADPPLQHHIVLIEQLLAFTLSTNDLEPGSISGKLDLSKNANSGIQELIQQSEISTAIEDEQEAFKVKEPGIVQIVRDWMDAYAKLNLLDAQYLEPLKGLPKLIEYKLQFDPTQPYINEKDKIDSMVAKKNSGLYTFKEMVAEAHPELDETELNAKVIELRADEEFKATLAAKNAPPVPAVPAKKIPPSQD